MTAMDHPQAAAGALSPTALSSMFQAVAGLRNLRAALAMLACFAGAVILGGLIATVLGRGVAGFALGSLATMVLAFTGVHAAGVLLMDQARGIPLRSVTDAVTYGLFCVPKSFALVIGLLLATAAVYLVLVLLFFVCKLPGLGPLLYALVFPLSVVVAGVSFAALSLALVIAMAALWEGATLTGALSKAAAVIHRRLVEAVLLMLVVAVLSSIVFTFVASVLLFGFWPTLGMSVSIISVSPEMFGGFDAFAAGMMTGPAGGYALAGLFGGGLLWALASTLVLQVGLLGVNLAYLRLTEGLDTSATEGALQARLAEARSKAAAMGNKAREAAERARTHAGHGAAPSAIGSHAEHSGASTRTTDAALAAAAPLTHGCPACHAPVGTEDLFCGSCGHRLQVGLAPGERAS